MYVKLVDYSPDWPDEYEFWRFKLLNVLKPLKVAIEHIGSTSVPGLRAKPVIDIALGIPRPHSLDELIEPMINAGLVYFPVFEQQMPDRRLFVQYEGGSGELPERVLDIGQRPLPPWRNAVNIHCWYQAESEFNRHIAFRNALRNDNRLRDAYARLKTELASREWADVGDYADAKSDFIRAVERDNVQGNRFQ